MFLVAVFHHRLDKCFLRFSSFFPQWIRCWWPSYQRCVFSVLFNSLIDLIIQFFLPSVRHRLLVGAPTAQTEQPGVQRGGAVFRCSTEVPDQCQPIPFDVTGNFSKFSNCYFQKKGGEIKYDNWSYHSACESICNKKIPMLKRSTDTPSRWDNESGQHRDLEFVAGFQKLLILGSTTGTPVTADKPTAAIWTGRSWEMRQRHNIL